MPRNMWEWLGIEETKDKTLIKKAYAQQSKKYHPEDYPKEAQRLREAYKKAMALASANKAACETGEEAFSVESYLDILHADISSDEKQEGFTYGHQESSKKGEGQASDGEGYLYSPFPDSYAGEEKKETGSEVAKTGYRYSPDAGSKVQDRDKKSSYDYNTSHLDLNKAERVFRLAGQLVFLHESSEYRGVPKVWRMVLENYTEQEDFKDPFVIAELVFVIEQMPYLEEPVWSLLQTMLFRYSDNSATWMRLKDRLRAAQQAIDIRLLEQVNRNASKQFTASLLLKVAGELYGTDSGQYKKYRFKAFCITSAIMIPAVLFLLLAVAVNIDLGKRQEKKEQQEIIDSMRKEVGLAKSAQEQRERRQKISGAAFIVENFREIYTEDEPYEIDLNNDGRTDHVYYDRKRGFFMVELYDSSKDTYVLYGTVDQFLEVNPDMYYEGFMAYFVGDAIMQ